MSPSDFRRRVDDLKRSISLRSLIEADGHKVVRAGGLDKCCCPFHKEKTPSFVIYEEPSRSHFYCFGCCVTGDVFGYVMRRDNCDFKTAVEKLSGGYSVVVHRQLPPPKIERIEVLPPSHFGSMLARWHELTDPSQLRDFSSKIGVTFESLMVLGAVYSDTNRAWAFPMCDHALNIVGIRLRSDDGKKWAVKGSHQGLFIAVGRPDGDLYVTEGPTDCAAMLSMGLFAIGKAAAMQGPEEIVKFIAKNRIRRVIVIADNDRAGLNGAKKLIDVCPVPCCELVLPAKDAREFYRNGGTKELIENLLKSAVWRHKQ